jgi:hypothetical protein
MEFDHCAVAEIELTSEQAGIADVRDLICSRKAASQELDFDAEIVRKVRFFLSVRSQLTINSRFSIFLNFHFEHHSAKLIFESPLQS